MPMTIRSVIAGLFLAVVAVTSCSSGDQPDANDAAKVQASIAPMPHCPIQAIAPKLEPGSPFLGWGAAWECTGEPVELGVDLYVFLEIQEPSAGGWRPVDRDKVDRPVVGRDSNLWTATWCEDNPTAAEPVKVRTLVRPTIQFELRDGLDVFKDLPEVASGEVLIHCTPERSKQNLG